MKQLIEEHGLRVRSYNLLKRAGVNTLDDLINQSPADIQVWRNMNPENLEEILDLRTRALTESREAITRREDESHTSFTIRMLLQGAWWEGHDVACVEPPAQCAHRNPHERLDA